MLDFANELLRVYFSYLKLLVSNELPVMVKKNECCEELINKHNLSIQVKQKSLDTFLIYVSAIFLSFFRLPRQLQVTYFPTVNRHK